MAKVPIRKTMYKTYGIFSDKKKKKKKKQKKKKSEQKQYLFRFLQKQAEKPTTIVVV